MKMLGFMIAMTLVYWVMANYAHSIISSVEPCPSAEIAATASNRLSAADIEPVHMDAGEGSAVKMSGRWSSEGDTHIVEAAKACAG